MQSVFDIDFALMAGELSLFLADLTAALGRLHARFFTAPATARA